MSHIFISYDHEDSDYAHRLADSLQAEGFNVWIDDRIDYGSQWPHEIQKQLDACDAFILVMSPRAFASEWVQSELQRAKRKMKPTFPLLLEGEEPWLSVESTQYYDVRGEQLPNERFYAAIGRVAARSGSQAGQYPAQNKKRSPIGFPKLRTEITIAIIGAVATLLAATIPILWSAFSDRSTPPATADINSPTLSVRETEAPVEVSGAQHIPMALIPASEFTMGTESTEDALARCQEENPDCELSWLEEEQPAHSVYLDAFYIDIYEVTNSLYADCVTKGVCEPPTYAGSASRESYYRNPEFDNYPVVFVDWNMARSYCEWRGGRLPTEAEWEKAARGTDARVYPWGNDLDSSYLNYNQEIGDTVEAGNYEEGQSPYGLYDMAGNVWEWVADWYSYSYYTETPFENPLGPNFGDERVVRGGSWYDTAYLTRTSVRNKFSPDFVDNNFGFRCAKDANP